MVQPVYCPKCGAMPIHGGWSWHLDNECPRKWPHVPQPRPVRTSAGSLGVVALGILLTVAVLLFLSRAHGETLAPVSPPTDWTGIAIVCTVCFAIVAVVGYIVHIKRTPGKQIGEAELDYIADRLHTKQQPAVVVTATPIVFDGITFADQSKLDEYKAAKAIVESHKGIAP